MKTEPPKIVLLLLFFGSLVLWFFGSLVLWFFCCCLFLFLLSSLTRDAGRARGVETREEAKPQQLRQTN